MRYLIILSILTSCGLYTGTDTVKLFPEGLPKNIDQILLDDGKAPPVEIISGPVIKAGIAGLLGPYAGLAGLAPPLVMLLSSFFITKRKKNERN